MYALVKNGSLERYPYSLRDLKKDNPNTSFPKEISEETANAFGAYSVVPTPRPEYDYSVNLTRTAVKQGDQWVEEWVSIPASPAELAQRTAEKEADVRLQRAALLQDTDWTQLGDSPVQPVNEWRTYRQALRDITSQPGYPHNITWPQPPSAIAR